MLYYKYCLIMFLPLQHKIDQNILHMDPYSSTATKHLKFQISYKYSMVYQMKYHHISKPNMWNTTDSSFKNINIWLTTCFKLYFKAKERVTI